MADIDGAVAEIVDVLATIDGIRFTPDDPPEGSSRWPMCLVFGSAAAYINGPPDVMTGLHDITIMLLVPRDYKRGLADAHSLLTSLQDDIPDALYQALTDRDFGAAADSSNFHTWSEEGISMAKEFAVDYEGTECLANVYTISGLKIMETLS